MSKNSITLVLNSTAVTNENGDSYVGYGFTAYRVSDNEEMFRIEDLSVDKSEIEGLMALIVDNDVSVAHFEDLIADFCV